MGRKKGHDYRTDLADLVQVSADADLGAGVKPVIGVLAIQVTPGEAVSVEITAGTPSEQA